MKLVICNFGIWSISELAYFELIRRDATCLKNCKSTILEFMSSIGEESWIDFNNQLVNYKEEFWKHPNYKSVLIRNGLAYQQYEYISDYRNDPTLIEIIEELGHLADDHNCKLKVIEIPDDVKYYIDDNGEFESVHENHRVWY